MKSRNSKRNRRVLILGGSVTLLIIASFFYLSYYIERKLEENIIALRGTVSSIHINLLTQSVKVNDLIWSSQANSVNLNPHFLKLSAVTAEGIGVYDLLMHKKLLIENITIDSGTVQYSRTIKQKGQKMGDSEYKHFLFRNITVHNIKTQIKTDTTTSFSALFNGQLGELHIDIDSLNNLNYSVDGVNALVENLNISRSEGMYGGSIARIHINTFEKKLVLDSALLIPNFEKYEFAHQRGEQIGRMNLAIPQIILEGFQYDKLIDSAFVAATMKIKSFDLYSFKDKRLPFLRDYNIPLPMEGFIKLAFQIKIDSILIQDSHISIEEHPEQGPSTGIITFDKLNATLTHLNNRITTTDPKTAQLAASALLLNEGSVNALFLFPLDGSPVYSTQGSISKMNLTTLNSLLPALANIRIESGYLNSLAFQFNYTDLKSTGTLNIDYSDLQLMSLDKNQKAIDGFKTFLMNTFIKNERSQKPSSNKQTAIIDIERDRKRYIPNVWVKSILGGLKSSVVGKTTDTKKKK